METNNILFERQPDSVFKKLIFGTIISLAIYLLIAGFSFNLAGMIIVAFALTITAIFGESQYFDGLIITADSIQVSKKSIFKGIVLYKILTKDISRITYVKGMHRTPQHLIIETQRKPSKVRVMIRQDIFKFAYVLRELKQNGITIKLHGGDHEVQLFLEGRIPDLPMTNDMEIR